MSSSSEYSGFTGRTVKCPAEKSTFSQTCSLLSQYLREKGSLGDLTLGMACTVESNGSTETSCHSTTTMELFPTIKNPVPVDFLTPQTAYPSPSKVPTIVRSSAFEPMEKEPKAAQLTIFYNGKVLVFDDFPADKAEEIMSLASKKLAQNQNLSAYAQTHSQQENHPSFVSNVLPQAPSRPIVRDLPIARKASLHRFLEKRKDRIASKAPYQIDSPNSAPKPVESLPWLGLSANSTQI